MGIRRQSGAFGLAVDAWVCVRVSTLDWALAPSAVACDANEGDFQAAISCGDSACKPTACDTYKRLFISSKRMGTVTAFLETTCSRYDSGTVMDGNPT
jgi:hypothetical protein